MRMGKDSLFIQHGLTTNRTAMEWFQRYYRAARPCHELPRRPLSHPHRRDLRAAAPGLIINNPHRHPAEGQLAIFEANDWEVVDAAQPAHDEPPALCYSSVWLSMNCLVLDPKTVIVEASEVHQQEQMDKLGMNVVPVDLRDAYPFGGGLRYCPPPTSIVKAAARTTSRTVSRTTPSSILRCGTTNCPYRRTSSSAIAS